MKFDALIFCIFLSLLSVSAMRSQTRDSSEFRYSGTADTIVNVGKYKLHFTLLKGEGVPILFEAGGGNDGSIWNSLKQHISEITNAPIITYDRMGLGKSSPKESQIGIEDEITLLELGLQMLGFGKEIMLVSHSLGGFYSTLFAARNPDRVAGIVFIDANLPCFFTESHLQKMKASESFKNDIDVMRRNPLPMSIPATDIVSGITLFKGTPEEINWKQCHSEFNSISKNREMIVAKETGHYVFLSNKQLVINAIVSMYALKVMPAEKANILQRGYKDAQTTSNDEFANLSKYCHSENDLNEWGYNLLSQNRNSEAVKVFEINALLNPTSANAYDSLGEVYLKMNNRELAILNYKKSLELNPKNENARKVLKQISR
jgi:hypothetical protein